MIQPSDFLIPVALLVCGVAALFVIVRRWRASTRDFEARENFLQNRDHWGA